MKRNAFPGLGLEYLFSGWENGVGLFYFFCSVDVSGTWLLKLYQDEGVLIITCVFLNGIAGEFVNTKEYELYMEPRYTPLNFELS